MRSHRLKEGCRFAMMQASGGDLIKCFAVSYTVENTLLVSKASITAGSEHLQQFLNLHFTATPTNPDCWRNASSNCITQSSWAFFFPQKPTCPAELATCSLFPLVLKVLKRTFVVCVSMLHNWRGLSPVCGSAGQPILFSLLSVWPNFFLSYITRHRQRWAHPWPLPMLPGFCTASDSPLLLLTLTCFVIAKPPPPHPL